MEVISYFEQENKKALREKIASCEWSAAKFLVKLLEENTFDETLGGWGRLFLLMDGEMLVSFCTLTGQDAIRDESLTPWIGFVFTEPEYRGRRCAGQVISAAEEAAAKLGYSRVYLETDHVGLYEKYGYTYQENRTDCWGCNARVLYREL